MSLSQLTLTLESIEKLAFFGPLVYPAAIIVGFLIDLAIWGSIDSITIIFYDFLWLLVPCLLVLPNIFTVPLMAMETYGLPEIAKSDQIVRMFDLMFSWNLLIVPMIQLGLSIFLYLTS